MHGSVRFGSLYSHLPQFGSTQYASTRFCFLKFGVHSARFSSVRDLSLDSPTDRIGFEPVPYEYVARVVPFFIYKTNNSIARPPVVLPYVWFGRQTPSSELRVAESTCALALRPSSCPAQGTTCSQLFFFRQRQASDLQRIIIALCVFFVQGQKIENNCQINKKKYSRERFSSPIYACSTRI